MGRAAVPAIVPVVDLARIHGGARRSAPLSSNFKKYKLFRHHTESENGNQSEVPILGLEIHATN